MFKFYTIRGLAKAVFFVSLLVIGCGDKLGEVKTTEPDKYQDWETYSYQNLRLHFPKNHPHRSRIADLAQTYLGAIRQDCRILNIAVPVETLQVYFYTGNGQAEQLTGKRIPFVSGDTIHYWVSAHLGTTLMQYLIPYWESTEPHHQFLKHGLIKMLDNSGRNFHVITEGLIKEGRFVPLAQLAVDTSIDSNTEYCLSGMAASFADFVIYKYGIEKFGDLYRSNEVFELSVRTIFDTSVDSLEQAWLEVVHQVAKAKEENAQDSGENK